MKYALTFEQDDNGTILVTSQDFPQMVTYGETEAQARANAIDAIESLIESMMAAREDIPAPLVRAPSNLPTVRLPLQTEMKVTLHRAMLASSMTRADLQRKLEWKRESIDRLFRLRHASKIGQIEQAIQATGHDARFVADDLVA